MSLMYLQQSLSLQNVHFVILHMIHNYKIYCKLLKKKKKHEYNSTKNIIAFTFLYVYI